jgi:phosphopantothenoylcysteine decarboxylase / phosphopantothenate---cysteine ligase
LSLTALAAQCPLILAPAMDGGMYAHPATQANLETLRQRGAIQVGPAEGHLASGLVGPGRMVEPQELLGHVRWALGKGGPLAGRNVIVTAGGTQEPLDPVRVIANRSSGKQGYAIAQAALDLGAQVKLISGPVSLTAPVGVQRVDVQTAQQMHDAVLASLPGADALVMAAAVADFRPVDPAENKLKKESGVPEIRFENTPDILKAVAGAKAHLGRPRVTVGFAAESQNLINNATAKLHAKKLDLIVANDIRASDAGFAVDTNRVTLLFADGGVEPLDLMSKEQVAVRVVASVVDMLHKTGA